MEGELTPCHGHCRPTHQTERAIKQNERIDRHAQDRMSHAVSC
jgi:hypothetical protein